MTCSTCMAEESIPTKKGGKEVGRTVRARFVKGRLEPAVPLDLAEGVEVTVTILEFPGRRDRDVSCRAAGAWKGTIAAEDLIRNIYADRLLSTRSEPTL